MPFKIAVYLVPHELACMGVLGHDAGPADAQRVLEWIKSGEGRKEPDRFTRTEVYRALRAYFKTAKALDPALAMLEEHAYIRSARALREKEGAGRAPMEYCINPAIQVQRRGDGPSIDVERLSLARLGDFMNRWGSAEAIFDLSSPSKNGKSGKNSDAVAPDPAHGVHGPDGPERDPWRSHHGSGLGVGEFLPLLPFLERVSGL